MANRFRALSNPHRLEIFRRLANCCPCRPTGVQTGEIGSCVGDLGRSLAIAPSTVSHHIRELKHAGLIHVERNGQRVICWVDPEVLLELAGFFERLPELPSVERGDQ